jgi:acetyl esterase/lipase
VPVERDLGAREVNRDAVYAERDSGPLRLDPFLPSPRDAPRPLVVYVHGGGWDSGQRQFDERSTSDTADPAQLADPLVRQGFAVATVDYHLSAHAKVADQVLDVGDGVRWLRENSAQWRLDPERVALWGGSAGGHLVSQLGVVAGDPVRFGPSDMSSEAQLGHPELGGYSRRAVVKVVGCVPVRCPVHAAEASPVKNVSGDEPPFLIQHGTADAIVPVDQSLDLAEELRAHGVPVEMHPYEGVGHGFDGTPLTPRILETAVRFLDAPLAR